MKKKITILILIAVSWMFLKFVDYYLTFPFDILTSLLKEAFAGVCLIIAIYQLMKLIAERRNIKKTHLSEMKKEIMILILIAVSWIFFYIIDYYLITLPYNILTFLLKGAFVGVCLIIAIYQLIKLIAERRNIKKIRIIKILFYGLMFYLACFVPVTSAIEKADWHILYRKRMEIVDKVKKWELTPNVYWNDISCELPFEFPIVSKDGNDITIHRNHRTQAITVGFYIIRGLSINPATCFYYTNDDEKIKHFDSLTAKNPRSNWKIKENWYRIRE